MGLEGLRDQDTELCALEREEGSLVRSTSGRSDPTS